MHHTHERNNEKLECRWQNDWFIIHWKISFTVFRHRKEFHFIFIYFLFQRASVNEAFAGADNAEESDDTDTNKKQKKRNKSYSRESLSNIFHFLSIERQWWIKCAVKQTIHIITDKMQELFIVSISAAFFQWSAEHDGSDKLNFISNLFQFHCRWTAATAHSKCN